MRPGAIDLAFEFVDTDYPEARDPIRVPRSSPTTTSPDAPLFNLGSDALMGKEGVKPLPL